MLKELRRHIFIGGVSVGQFERDRQHAGTVIRHPGGPVGLFQMATGGERFGTVEDSDVVQPQKSAGEDMAVVDVLSIDPQSKVEQQFLKDASQEFAVPISISSG